MIGGIQTSSVILYRLGLPPIGFGSSARQNSLMSPAGRLASGTRPRPIWRLEKSAPFDVDPREQAAGGVGDARKDAVQSQGERTRRDAGLFGYDEHVVDVGRDDGGQRPLGSAVFPLRRLLRPLLGHQDQRAAVAAALE